ncbi:hypothetical protein E2C01_070230 [Portunus trituberculatus]|uniref:Uncharacterized protein n=1 Tax=Portunus trituberculatus TaxID=210409 RepID=A0A5B7I0R9_PORTR|nr:hypothetical protein [Portunus trituberculatus]
MGRNPTKISGFGRKNAFTSLTSLRCHSRLLLQSLGNRARLPLAVRHRLRDRGPKNFAKSLVGILLRQTNPYENSVPLHAQPPKVLGWRQKRFVVIHLETQRLRSSHGRCSLALGRRDDKPVVQVHQDVYPPWQRVWKRPLLSDE